MPKSLASRIVLTSILTISILFFAAQVAADECEPKPVNAVVTVSWLKMDPIVGSVFTLVKSEIDNERKRVSQSGTEGSGNRNLQENWHRRNQGDALHTQPGPERTECSRTN